MYGTTILNGRGDLTIAWDNEDDAQILAMIEAKMKEGYSFFLIEPRLGGMATPNRIQLTNLQDALRQRMVSMKLADRDKTVAGLIETQVVTPVPTPEKPAKTTRKAKTAKEVASGESVAVKPRRGG